MRFSQSGRRYFYNDPSLEPPLMSDLLYGLGGIIRGTGQWDRRYDVLRHSWVCWSFAFAETRNDEFAIACGYHDLHEAVVGDVNSPLKSLLPDYRLMEGRHKEYLTDLFSLPRLAKVSQDSLHMLDQAVGDVEAEMWVRDWVPQYSIDNPRSIQDRAKIREFINRSMSLHEDAIAAQLCYELTRYYKTAGLPDNPYVLPISVRKVPTENA